MKPLKTLFLAITISIMISSFLSCSEEEEPQGRVRVSNFTIPELTQRNSIQVTVDIKAATDVQLHIYGKKVAVDWGDGSEIEKDDLTQNRGPNYDFSEEFSHKYSSNGEYTIKVWSAEVTQFSLSTDLITKAYSFNNIAIGYCPVLETLYLENLSVTELVFDSNIPKLTQLNLQMMDNITSLDVASLHNLKKLFVTNLAELNQLDVSQNHKLWDLSCHNLPEMNLMTFKNNTELTWVQLSDCSKLTSIDMKEVPKLANFLVNRVPLTSLDLSKQVGLASLHCNETNLTEIDLSYNIKLYDMSISNNQLTKLDITKNSFLMRLRCANNKLTALDVSQNKELESLDITNNLLSTTALDKVFTDLPKSKYAVSKMPPPPQYSVVAAYGNPGYKDCKTKIITDKGWKLYEKD